MRLSLLLALSTLTLGPVAQAQIVSDGTTGTIVNNAAPAGDCGLGVGGNCTTINGGTVMGSNLFHSFSDFSLPWSPFTAAARFENNNANVTKIISRVTGNNISNIDGILQSGGTNPNFDLILINPNGITFGPNANLALNGSFLASTAQSVTFADGNQFSANPAASTLTMSAPIGLQFGATAAPINVQPGANIFADLFVNPGNTLALIGGPINIDDRSLIAANDNGRVEIGSVAPNSFVGITHLPNGFTFDYSKVQTFQDITLSNDSNLTADTGNVRVFGRNITATGGSAFATLPSATQDGGRVEIFGSQSVQFDGTRSGAFAQNPGFNNKAGSISINTPLFTVKNGALVLASTVGAGAGGEILVNAGVIEISGTRSGLLSESNAGATGAGGNITINANLLSILQGGRISTSTASTAPSGNISINSNFINVSGTDATGIPSLISAETLSSGKGGNIGITTRQLTVTDNGQIRVKTRSAGDAGNLNIIASELINLDRNGTLLAETTGSGQAGKITARTNQFLAQNGGTATTRSTATGNANTIDIIARSIWLNNGILSSTTRDTVGGSINLNASAEINLDNNSIVSAIATGAGTSGTINATTPNLNLRNNSQITVSNKGTGNANNLSIFASRINLDNSQITSETISGAEGNINIRDWQTLTLNNSKASASTQNGTGGTIAVSGFGDMTLDNNSSIEALATGSGTSGNITFSTIGAINIQNNSQASVSNTGTGNSGNLEAQAREIFLTNQGRINASTAAGEGGNILLKAYEGSIILRNNSEITATANGTGNGGNISLEAARFILGIFGENSDIVANAFQGRGGSIYAKALGIFGFRQFLNVRTPESDFVASSELGIDGNVTINTQDNLSLDSLPDDFISTTLALGCQLVNGDSPTKLSNSGSSGLPDNSGIIWEDIPTSTAPSDTSRTPSRIVEAQGVVQNEQGQIQFIATAPPSLSSCP